MTKLKKIFICLFFISNLSFNEKIESNDYKPFQNIDFKQGNWLLTLNEIITDTSINNFGKSIENIRLINDEQILDSLKFVFKCDLNKQSDGYHSYVITLYKNNRLKKEYYFDNLDNFDFGAFRKYFIKITKSRYLKISGTEKLSQEIKRLTNKHIDFYYSSEFEHFYHSNTKNSSSKDNQNFKSDYTYNLEISFKNLHNMAIDIEGATNEFFKIYPKLNNDSLIFKLDGNTRKNNYRLYKFGFPCSKNFSIDSMKNSANVLFINITGIKPTEYYLTKLIK